MNNSFRQYTPLVYFKNNEKSSPASAKDSSDFLSFNDSQGTPAKKEFSPGNYSSPRQPWKSPNPYWKSPNQQFKSPNQQWKPPNQQFRSPHQQWANPRTPGHYQKRHSNQNSSFSPNKTYNSSYYKNYNKRGSKDNSFSKERYLHPSFMENPWAQLEAELEADKAEIEMFKNECDDDEVQEESENA